MPKKEGRTGLPGNSTEYKSIDIAVSNPGLLQPGAARAPKHSTSAGTNSVPSWGKGKFMNKEKGAITKKSY